MGLGTEMKRSEEAKTPIYGFTERLSSPCRRLAPPLLHPLALSWPPGEITAGAPNLRSEPSLPPCQLQRNEMPAGARTVCARAGGWAGPGQGREPLAAPPRDISRPARPFQPPLETR